MSTCRSSAGICDIAEECDGFSNACPPDDYVAALTTCRPSSGICDTAESCTGSSAPCPFDAFVAAATTCRAAAGVCDVAEACTGGDTACPADAKSTSVCRSSSGLCDSTESCDGTSNTCPANAFLSTAATCRTSAGACDVAENCTGTAASCPGDAFVAAASTCRASAGVCDIAESCTGSTAACPGDTFVAAASLCRAAVGVCDQAENCSGSAAACPANAFVPAATTCRLATGICDVTETCTGGGAACPADDVAVATTECRASAGECDVAENCTGSTKTCPANAFAAFGMGCTTDTDLCTDDVCDGVGVCSHPPIPLAPVCNWAIVGGSDTRSSRVRTRVESRIQGSVCADRADIGESSTLIGTASWALLDDSGKAATVRLNAAVPDGSVVTGGGCLEGFGGFPIFGTIPGPICCADGDVELPGGNPSNVINACGLHDLIGACTLAKAQVPNDVALLDALLPTADLGAVTIASGQTGVISAGAGLNVIDIDRIRLRRNATLTVDAQGNAGAVVVLRLAAGLSASEGAVIELIGGALPENVLFYASGGGCSVGLGNVGAGTLFCPEGAVRLRQASEWTGSIAGGATVDVGWNVKLTHVPFFGLAQ